MNEQKSLPGFNIVNGKYCCNESDVASAAQVVIGFQYRKR